MGEKKSQKKSRKAKGKRRNRKEVKVDKRSSESHMLSRLITYDDQRSFQKGKKSSAVIFMGPII